MKANPDPPPCWGGLLICIYPGVIIFSILVQCFITAWRVDHKHRPRSRRRTVHHRASSRPRETREEARQRKYRYLYQVRTARGDIISQVWINHSFFTHGTNWFYMLIKSKLNKKNSTFFNKQFVSFTELCIGIAKTRSARISTAIGALNQNQFTRTKHTQQRSHTFHQHTSRLGHW